MASYAVVYELIDTKRDEVVLEGTAATLGEYLECSEYKIREHCMKGSEIDGFLVKKTGKEIDNISGRIRQRMTHTEPRVRSFGISKSDIDQIRQQVYIGQKMIAEHTRHTYDGVVVQRDIMTVIGKSKEFFIVEWTAKNIRGIAKLRETYQYKDLLLKDPEVCMA